MTNSEKLLITTLQNKVNRLEKIVNHLYIVQQDWGTEEEHTTVKQSRNELRRLIRR